MNKFIILDRDGTLNEDYGYAHKIKDFKLIPGVIEALNLLKNQFKFIMITNQSGIGRGYFKEEDFHNFNDNLLDILKKHNIKIEKTYFCPHIPEDNCDCRKPNTTYIKQAEKEFNINLKESFVIGDHPCDVKLGKNAGCKTIYLLTGHGVQHLNEARNKNPDYIAENLTQAKDYILSNNQNKIIERKDIENLTNKLKRENKTVVTLNGTFDILHKGHEKIITEAKKQGDILIVGLNSDSSVKQNKGPNRPLNKEIKRAKMLANFKGIDYVTIFNETTPIPLLEIIKPNIHVNGSDYGKNCIEEPTIKKYGGKIHIVKLKEGFSTTKLIKQDGAMNKT